MLGADTLRWDDVSKRYPEYNRGLVDDMLRAEAARTMRKIVVLDDDPTGVQTVHGVSVYTDWSMASVRAGFAEENRMFFILTNSRSFTEEQTEAAHREIMEHVEAAARECGAEYVVISRGDSTLRGHYPLETEVIRRVQEEAQEWQVDGEILCPFFAEGGRYTIDNIHYVKMGAELVPAGATEFARDKTFGYRSSDLRDYIEEKTGGGYRAESVTCVTLEALRGLRVDDIAGQLAAVTDFNKVVVNAVDEYDLKVFCIALYRALRMGKHYTFRTAAAFVKVFGLIDSRPLLARPELVAEGHGGGGVIIIGSHTRKTTEQMAELRQLEGIEFIEMNSDLVLEPGGLAREVSRITARMEALIRAGITVAVYTRRQLLVLEDDTGEAALLRSVAISDAVQSLVGTLSVVPAFVIAKGGITSSDIGTKALGVRRAEVLGQIQPGVPVWRTGPESRFPGIPYVIFPGNVGEMSTLRKAAEVLMREV